MASDCRFTTIGCERGCCVDRREHGTIHLTLGDVTLLHPSVASQRPC